MISLGPTNLLNQERNIINKYQLKLNTTLRFMVLSLKFLVLNCFEFLFIQYSYDNQFNFNVLKITVIQYTECPKKRLLRIFRTYWMKFYKPLF